MEGGTKAEMVATMHEILGWLGKVPDFLSSPKIDLEKFDIQRPLEEISEEELLSKARDLRAAASKATRELLDALATATLVKSAPISRCVNNLVSYSSGLDDLMRRATREGPPRDDLELGIEFVKTAVKEQAPEVRVSFGPYQSGGLTCLLETETVRHRFFLQEEELEDVAADPRVREIMLGKIRYELECLHRKEEIMRVASPLITGRKVRLRQYNPGNQVEVELQVGDDQPFPRATGTHLLAALTELLEQTRRMAAAR